MSSLAAHATNTRLPTMPPGLSQEDQQELAGLAITLRIHFESLNQTVVQIAWITFRMAQLIGDQGAQEFFCEVCGRAASTFRHYRYIGKVVNRFLHPDGHIPPHITRLPLNAFKLIDDSDDVRLAQVIDEEAQKGPLSLSQVKQIVEQATAELRTELEEANAQIGELTATTAEAQANAQDAEKALSVAQAKHDAVVVELRSHERQVTDVAADRDAILKDLREAQQEIDRLRLSEKEVSIVETPVEVLPKDVESLEHARRELAEVTARRDRLNLELVEIDQKISQARDAADALDQLEKGAADLLSAFPAAAVLAMRASNTTIGARVDQLADQLRALADALSSSHAA
ncbi:MULTISPECIES: hypothetical protein [unclassified Paraburkholderia]|uniref:hypothetical protein n=1 Tax=unclassified Paraburkholderia TaxID=2615204 RepID=UPI002AAF5DDC|nr:MULTISPECIES: hypothetical protein [unclassified Paraburkholderia]